MTSARKNCRWLRRSHSSDERWPRWDGSDEEALKSASNLQRKERKHEVAQCAEHGSGSPKEGGNEGISSHLETFCADCNGGGSCSYPSACRLATACLVLFRALRWRHCRFDV